MSSTESSPQRNTNNQNKNNDKNNNIHANLHVASFLELDCPVLDGSQPTHDMLQIVHDGHQLTAENLLQQNNGLDLTKPIFVNDTPESIGMKVPKFRNRDVQVPDIATILGDDFPIDVIDVEYQEELEGWTLGDFVQYVEDPRRKRTMHNNNNNNNNNDNKMATIESSSSTTTTTNTNTRKRQRKAAVKAMEQKQAIQRPRVLNQISLEFSQTPLRRQVLSPQFVRDMDWIDCAWPHPAIVGAQRGRAVYPQVQYYCLTSAAGCYTDFHVDFGGTSVWYHVLSGHKEFCLIAPTKANLQVYEEWLCRPDQISTFLPTMMEHSNDIIRVSLQASNTMIIPAGWIHAVYTPSDSVVLGGNFLHGLDMQKQLDIFAIEDRTKVNDRFRFPLFRQLHFYVGSMYLNKLRTGNISPLEVAGCHYLIEELNAWWEDLEEEDDSLPVTAAPNVATAANEAAQQQHCTSVDHFLFALKQEYNRVVQHGIGPSKSDKQASASLLSQSIAPSGRNVKKVEPPSQAPAAPNRPKLKLKLNAVNSDDKMQPTVTSEPQSDTVVSSSESAETKRPRIRLRGHAPSSHDPSDGSFRIVLSSKTSNNTSTSIAAVSQKKTRTKRVKEDTEWFDDGFVPDDEWVPSNATNKKTTKKKKRVSATSKKATSVQQQQQQQQQPKGRSRQTPKPTTARQRLMKRFR